MTRYIDAEKFKKEMYHEAFETDSDMQKWDSGCWIRYKLFKDCLEKQPTADVVKVVHGEWIKHKPDPEVMRLFHQEEIALAMGENSIYWTCSECGSWDTPIHKYCPNCGAKMDGKKME